MKKTAAKLIILIMALVVAASLVGMSSYAWMTMSGDPEVDGIQINIGGSDTILVAADVIVKRADGSIYHIPGEFSDTLNFSQYDTYDYLSGLAGLTPVSTADGVHWILPDYYAADDPEVQQGLAVSGQIKDITDFRVDTSLDAANLTADEVTVGEMGSYIYLDFWVVSPAANYKLRVSTGDAAENSGSFVVSLPTLAEDGNGGYTLVSADETAASSVRVGFLVNLDWAAYEDVQYYLDSDGYDGRYTRLLGQYQEPGESLAGFADAKNWFTIYEPNGDLHPHMTDGDYFLTNPLGVVNDTIATVDVRERLTMQLTNRWRTAADGAASLLSQEFVAATIGMDLSSYSPEELEDYFYEERLQGLLTPYVTRGQFVSSTGALYSAAKDGVVTGESDVLSQGAGATDDVYMTVLQKEVPQRIRMFIWIEGQDVDCVNHVVGSDFMVNLEFAGSNNE